MKYGSIKLYKGYGYEVGCDFTASGNKLIIDPKSNLEEGSNYYISGYVYASEYNKTDNIYGSFSTLSTTPVVTLDPASKASLSFNSDKSLLTITAPTGASKIIIYKTDQTSGEFYKDDERDHGLSDNNFDGVADSWFSFRKGLLANFQIDTQVQ